MLTATEEHTVAQIMDLLTDALVESGVRHPDLESMKCYLMRAVTIARTACADEDTVIVVGEMVGADSID